MGSASHGIVQLHEEQLPSLLQPLAKAPRSRTHLVPQINCQNRKMPQFRGSCLGLVGQRLGLSLGLDLEGLMHITAQFYGSSTTLHMI